LWCQNIHNVVADLVCEDSIAAFETLLKPREHDKPPLFTPKALAVLMGHTRTHSGKTVQALANDCIPAIETLTEKLGGMSPVTTMLRFASHHTPEILPKLVSDDCLRAFDDLLTILKPSSISTALNGARANAPNALLALASEKDRLQALETHGVQLSSFCQWLNGQSKKDFSSILDTKLTELEEAVANGTYSSAMLDPKKNITKPEGAKRVSSSFMERPLYH
jgi:hypothetical protein